MLKTLFTWCDLLCMRCILVCDVRHEWVPYLFYVIAMCNFNVSTLQIAFKPIAPCEQFHKNACIKLSRAQSKLHRVNGPSGHDASTIFMGLPRFFRHYSVIMFNGSLIWSFQSDNVVNVGHDDFCGNYQFCFHGFCCHYF